MKLKKLIIESVILDTIDDLHSDISSIKEELNNRMIAEGVDDPGILKCVFMAGGPGSGKSYKAEDIFGVDRNIASGFSKYGLKVVNSDRAFEAGLKKNGINPKDLARIEKDDPELYDVIINNIRPAAKALTAKQKSFFESGRLGMIIDGTGHSFDKIKKQKDRAESLGYDCFMIFVDTSLKIAMERNRARDRTLSDEIVQSYWKDVQDNKSKFKSLFGGNFALVTNNNYDPHVVGNKRGVDILGPTKKEIQSNINRFINAPVKNPIGKNWIVAARNLKNANLIK